MKRIAIEPRDDWRQKLDRVGFGWRQGNIGEETYWDESGYWQFTASEIDHLEEATAELYDMVNKAVKHVISNRLYSRLAIPDFAIPAIEATVSQTGVYGRFDLAFDGVRNPKMLEFNAETPTSLYEAAVVQWLWLEERFPNSDQFNSIHEKLEAAWRKQKATYGTRESGALHLTQLGTESIEDVGTVRYMAECAKNAGWETHHMTIESIGKSSDNQFADDEGYLIKNLFKLYPWDWIVTDNEIDSYGRAMCEQVAKGNIRVIEPAWKMVANHKGLLEILWELFPKHPYLLEAHTDREKISGRVVAKPMLGREGQNVVIADVGETVNVIDKAEGVYEDTGYVYQRFVPLPKSSTGGYAVIGSWIVNGEPAGIGIRESAGLITGDTARFIPHKFG